MEECVEYAEFQSFCLGFWELAASRWYEIVLRATSVSVGLRCGEKEWQWEG